MKILCCRRHLTGRRHWPAKFISTKRQENRRILLAGSKFLFRFFRDEVKKCKSFELILQAANDRRFMLNKDLGSEPRHSWKHEHSPVISYSSLLLCWIIWSWSLFILLSMWRFQREGRNPRHLLCICMWSRKLSLAAFYNIWQQYFSKS